MAYIIKNTAGLINTRLTDVGRRNISQGNFNIAYFQIGVYGITGLATLYTNASPGFVDGATVYTNVSLTMLAPTNMVFRYPNSVNSTVYQIVSDGVMSFTGAYGGPC